MQYQILYSLGKPKCTCGPFLWRACNSETRSACRQPQLLVYPDLSLDVDVTVSPTHTHTHRHLQLFSPITLTLEATVSRPNTDPVCTKILTVDVLFIVPLLRVES